MNNLIKYLSFQAKQRPNNVALYYGQETLSFFQLEELVKKLANKLRRSGIRPGQIISTQINNPLLHVAITLALFHEGAISCATPDYLTLPSSVTVDHYIADPEHLNALTPMEKLIQVDAQWVESVFSESHLILPQIYLSKNNICRLILTSGTTSEPKVVAISHSQLEASCYYRAAVTPQQGCRLSLFDVCTSVGLFAIFKTLISGLPLYLPHSYEKIIEDLPRLNITNLIGSPGHLAQLVAHTNGEKSNKLQSIIATGSLIGQNLLELMQQRLCSNIINRYASTEASITAFCNADILKKYPSAAGYPFPNTTIQIVDQDSALLTSGQVGTIRVKNPYMAKEYYKNSGATNDSFADGWFYPGDIGHINQDGVLILEGRRSDIINLGGAKINPNTIDQFLLKEPGIMEVASMGIENQLGNEELWTAIVAVPSINLASLTAKLIQNLPTIYSQSKLLLVDRIPRNHSGKINKTELKKVIVSIKGSNNVF